jgi:hypothetical protein
MLALLSPAPFAGPALVHGGIQCGNNGLRDAFCPVHAFQKHGASNAYWIAPRRMAVDDF